MKILIEFWGDSEKLPLAEFRGIMEGEKKEYKVLQVDYPIAVVRAEEYDPLERAGLLRRVSKWLYSGKKIPKLEMNLENYAIRVRGGESENIIRTLAKGIRGKVNLESPKNVVMVYRSAQIHVGLQLFAIDSSGFEARRSKNLPVSYPITMHPRLARFMVNLARVKKGAKILDPFCGTGSILIEAGLAGMEIYGSDLDAKMIEASQINLKKFGVDAKLEKKDVGEIEGNYDAVVTDPPYGRSSSTAGEKLYQLYNRAFRAFSEVTSRVVIALPDLKALKIGEEYFTLAEFYSYRVHKSLTRYFAYYHS